MEPNAVFTHHALNMADDDTIKKCVMLKYRLDTCYELTKLIKCSSKHDTILKRLKDESLDDALLSAHCPTQWTVCVESHCKTLWPITLTTLREIGMYLRNGDEGSNSGCF